jgi:hypothetical protein
MQIGRYPTNAESLSPGSSAHRFNLTLQECNEWKTPLWVMEALDLIQWLFLPLDLKTAT